MAELTFEGYKYDTETRKVTFTQQVCWNCKGTGQSQKGTYCPHYGKKTIGRFPHGKCPVCGSTRKDDHKIIEWNPCICPQCNGTGILDTDAYSSLDYSPLLEHIEIVLASGMHSASFNESYLGIGVIGGCTDYGRYLTEINHDMSKMVEYARKESVERNRYEHGCAILTQDGYLIQKAVVKCNDSGWTMFSIGTKTSVVVES